MASSSRRILFIVPSYGATGWYRANAPGKELAKRGHTVHLDVALDQGIIHEYDLLVFSNGASAAAATAMEYAKSSGKQVIADMDDDPWHMTEANPHTSHWNEQEQQVVEACLSVADRVTTTNPFLAEFLTGFNGSVKVLPNCLPEEYWNLEKVPNKKTVIGWLGGITHYDDLLMIAEPINRLLADRSDVEFHLTVFEENPFEPKSKVKVLPPKIQLAEYPELFRGIDIGIAPLVDDHFNKSKSDLKFLEYSAAGVPCVASNISTYSRSVRHEENGFLAATSDEWVECLTRLVEDKALRARIGAEARKFAETRFISPNIGLWEKAYGLPPS